MSGIFGILEVSGSGLSAQRRTLNAVAENIANVETTRTPEGGPYRRKQVIFSEHSQSSGFARSLGDTIVSLQRTDSRHFDSIERSSVIRSEIPLVEEEEIEAESFKMIYDPTHPDADRDGYVAMPDIDIIAEMVDMMAATRAYEANVSVAASAKTMYREALGI